MSHEDFVPLREHIESLFDAHKAHVDQRFDRIERYIDNGHKHRGYVPWAAFITALLTIAGFIIGT